MACVGYMKKISMSISLFVVYDVSIRINCEKGVFLISQFCKQNMNKLCRTKVPHMCYINPTIFLHKIVQYCADLVYNQTYVYTINKQK